MSRLSRTLLAACLLALAGLTGLPAQEGKTKAAKVEVTADEQKLIDLINQERTRAGLAPLRVNLDLVAAARAHAGEMAVERKMAHKLNDARGDRIVAVAFGDDKDRVERNIAWSEGYYPPETVVRYWMEKRIDGKLVTREHILDPDLKETGLGVVLDRRTGEYYYAQYFAGPGARKGPKEATFTLPAPKEKPTGK